MILTVDVGNTNIVLGVYKEEVCILTMRLKTDATRTEDEYAISLNSMLRLKGIDPDALEGAIISSVVPNLSPVLSAALEKLTDCPPLVVGPGIKTGLNIKIDNPSQLGSDLVVGAVAGIEKYGAPLIVIDMGTATTFSAIAPSGDFLGGSIVPGLKVSLGALAENAAQISQVNLQVPPHAIGTNTTDSLCSGLLFGYADLIDGMCERIEKEIGVATKVVATGGLAPRVMPLCRREIIVDPNLLTDGLFILYNKNR